MKSFAVRRAPALASLDNLLILGLMALNLLYLVIDWAKKTLDLPAFESIP